MKYTLQVAPEDCTGCGLCVEVCPAKNKSEAKHKAINMGRSRRCASRNDENWDFFLQLPEIRPRAAHRTAQVKDVQLLQPLFEFSGACAGCGETPYIKLLTQLFGDRALIANATGCSSIYGGNLPTTPYTVNRDGRGPAWSNSLFEDNAEFGLGMRLALDKQNEYARELVQRLAPADRRRAGRRDPRRRSVDRGRHPRAARAGGASCKEKLAERRRIRQPAICWPWPTRWSRRACGSSAATAGPTTSATADWITCWPPAANVNVLRARHRGLLQHRRPDVEGHAARRGGEVRRRRQAHSARKTWP